MATTGKRPVVNSIRHAGQTRPNIPTEELRDFVAEAEEAPTTLLYPRDPSLDPQLVWKGKDEQDRADLAVPVVPIYIQEKIHPEALVEGLALGAKAATGKGIAEDETAYQIDLFNDFDDFGADFERKVAFYEHDQQWTNRMILGDSLLVMASLAEKEGLKGKVQCIYLDPPYGIKFNSNWQVSTRKRDVRDGKAEDVTRQPEQIRAFRDTWELGIHSYLAYLRERLVVAGEMLAESGSIFLQIGDDNVHLVRSLMDEVFGGENFVNQITYSKTSGAGSFAVGTNVLASVSDFIIWYAKDLGQLKYRQMYLERRPGGSGADKYTGIETANGERRPATQVEFAAGGGGGRLFRLDNLTSQTTRTGQTTVFPIEIEGRSITPTTGGWKTNREGMTRLIHANRVALTGRTASYVRYFDDFPAFALANNWPDIGGIQSRADPKIYAVQTSTTAVQRCLLMTTDPGDLVLDPTCGSGTTAYVAEQWGRRWITIDTSRVALALARTRLMAAKFPWYLLADSPEGVRKEADLTGVMPPPHPTLGDIRKGFVYKRVPHVTLKSIANNPDIREGMTREEIDAAIARHADSEILYDQPYEDGKRVRVSGPFTVESLSPHRVLSTADEDFDGVVTPAEREGQRDFTTMILDNLRAAGAQNTIKQERLTFDRLEPFPGRWLQGAGEFTDGVGAVKRVAVSIGPEHGTVGPEQVKEAAKEAVQGVGFDILLVCGFAFDAHVSEEAKRFGKLTVLPTRMNPDLAMGDDLLKKTGAGNLFMVFGEPDIAIEPAESNQIRVHLRGVDVYDPTSGEIRSSSTDDVACWFIDTAYDGEAFFVRHAYFTGAGDPYDKLRRALRAQIDEAAWSALYSTVSRPFPRPSTGRIAVKAINHFGDEVLKVFEA